LEIPDSDNEDDEDYGWADEDEIDMPVMPPQWQGSEDILVAPPRDVEGEEGEEVEEGGGGGKVMVEENVGQREIEDSEDELAL